MGISISKSQDRPPLILHLIDELRMGGAQIQLITQLAAAVRLYPHRHRVLCLFGEGELVERIRALGIEVEVLDLRPHVQNRRYFEMLALLRRRIREIGPDLVEGYLTWSRIFGLMAAFMAGVRRRIGHEQGDIYFNSPKARALNFGTQWSANTIVTCSQALKRWMVETHGIAGKRIEVIHNCIDPTAFGNFGSPGLNRREFAPRPETVIFCCVGTLGSGVNKRVDLSLRALARARASGADLLLLVCGDGPLRLELEGLAKELGIAEHVQFLGTRGDIDQVMAISDAFCHAAPFEPFGIVCIEAMWMRLPVLVPACGGLVEIVEDEKDGLLYPPLDEAAMSEGMLRLARDPALRARLGEGGHNKVAARFTVEANLRKLYGLYGLPA